MRTAVELAGPGLGAVRIDSGDLPMVARQVRALLDELGAHRTRIVLTGDLDEHSIAALAAAPVDGYGVGTALVTGSGAPTAALVYKLVARALEGNGAGSCARWPSGRSASRAGAGASGRSGTLDDGGIAECRGDHPGAAASRARPTGSLLRPLVRRGEIVGREPLSEARERHQRALAELPPHATSALPRLPGDPHGVRAERRIEPRPVCRSARSGPPSSAPAR